MCHLSHFLDAERHIILASLDHIGQEFNAIELAEVLKILYGSTYAKSGM
jgi:hypothetical protein